jgi:alkyl hydroperoxide reductase subunit AhpC
MSIRIGDTAPDFEAVTTIGKINFYNWLENSWGVLFSHPEDYTPVCTTELGVVANLKNEFARRNVKTIALSVDTLASHKGWIADIEEIIETKIEFPIIADEYQDVARLYGMLPASGNNKFTIRSVFIIGADKEIRVILSYPVSVGRNFDEILRVIDALQLSENYSVVTPANWQYGDKVIIDPKVPTEKLNDEFPEGYEEVKPYLRFTEQPKP